MRTMAHFLCFILGGFFMGRLTWFAGLIAFLGIMGMPWVRACKVVDNFTFFLVGREAIHRKELPHKHALNTRAWSLSSSVLVG